MSMILKNASWAKINDTLLSCGNVRDPKALALQAIKSISRIITFDEFCIYFRDKNGRIFDKVLFNASRYWNKQFLDFYSNCIEEQNLSDAVSPRVVPEKHHLFLYDWCHASFNEFVRDIIKPQGLTHSLAFSLLDTEDVMRISFSLNRTRDNEFSDEELMIMRVLQPHLNNLHRNLYVQLEEDTGTYSRDNTLILTKREQEIADLLCRSFTPEMISRRLQLSIGTVYRHIANIHKKLHVSNMQGLLVKLFEMRQENNQLP